MELHESAEMYLETILYLQEEHSGVRSVDVANALNYKKSSVSVALKKLRENGYLETDSEGFLFLTQTGMRIAETMDERHRMFADWLEFLGVKKEIALRDACKIEHVISAESFDAIKKHVALKPQK
ncbi:MAG: metal-dependent transcriptional regulator [Anaerofustis sp.]